jgi:hypothetical protein
MSVPKVMLVAVHGEAYEQHMMTVKEHRALDQAVPTSHSRINASIHASNASAFELIICYNLPASLT